MANVLPDYNQKKANSNKNIIRFITILSKYKWYYIFMIPGIIYFVIFMYIPMYGITIAFKDFDIIDGYFKSPWVGLEHFKFMFSLPKFHTVFRNTVLIGTYKLIFTFPIPVIVALMLNELRFNKLKRVIQTSIYIPHFLSWSVIGGIVYVLFSPQYGVIETISSALGLNTPNVLLNKKYFRSLLVGASIWKTTGWSTIIYLAALTSIDPTLYEAAHIDGANMARRIWHISIPGIINIIFVVFLVRIGNIMNTGFAQIMALQNPLVIEVSETIETYVYKTGIVAGRFSFTTAVGLINSVIGFTLVMITNTFKKKLTGEGLW